MFRVGQHTLQKRYKDMIADRLVWGWCIYNMNTAREDTQDCPEVVTYRQKVKGRPKSTWRRTTKIELRKIGLTWEEVQAIRKTRWGDIIGALCPTGGYIRIDDDDDESWIPTCPSLWVFLIIHSPVHMNFGPTSKPIQWQRSDNTCMPLYCINNLNRSPSKKTKISGYMYNQIICFRLVRPKLHV